MQTKEIRQKTNEELLELIKKLREDLFKLNTDLLQGKEKDVKKSLKSRKEIAKILTIVNEKKVLKEVTNE